MRRKIRKFFIVVAAVAVVIVATNAITQAISLDVKQTFTRAERAEQAVLAQAVTPPSRVLPSEACQSLHQMIQAGTLVELVGEQVDKRNLLYQMWYHDVPENYFTVTVMFGEACGIAYHQYDEAITNRVPLEVARSLTLQFYQKLADVQGGVSAYQKFLNESYVAATVEEHELDSSFRSGSPTEHQLAIVTSVEAWAYEQMGITLPKGTYQVLNIDDAWIYDNNDL